MNKNMVGLVGVTLLAAFRLNAAEGGLDRYNVLWDSPSRDAHGSMPLGNGDVGINAWVEGNGDLVFYVSKTDAWDENARLCKIGRVRVKFDPPLAVKDGFRQELKLRDGVIEITSTLAPPPSDCGLTPTSRWCAWRRNRRRRSVAGRRWNCGACASGRWSPRRITVTATARVPRRSRPRTLQN